MISKFINKEDIIINTKNLIYNTGNGDCWFKTISQALFNDEEYHLSIRKKIYESLIPKKSYYKDKGLTINNNNEIVPISEYIDKIKFSQQWSGDVEISETSIVYNINIVIYKVNKIENNKCNLSYYNLYGDLKNDNKPLIFVALLDNKHYQLIDYNNNHLFVDNGLVVDSEINIKNGENLECDYYYNLSKCYKNNLLNKTENDYPYYPDYNNEDFFYIDIINYLKSNIENLKSNNNNAKKIWPKFIEDIKDKKNQNNKKRLFRIKAGKYIYFKDTLYVNKNLDYFI